jgi:hypothetical protein
MATAPASRAPLGGSSGDLKQDLKGVRAEIRAIEKEMASVAKAGGRIDKDQLARLRRAQAIETATKKAMKESGASFNNAAIERQAKMIMALNNSESISRIISGRGSAHDIAQLLGNDRVTRVIESALNKVGLSRISKSFGNIAPLIGVGSDLADLAIQSQERGIRAMQTAEEAALRGFNLADQMGLDPELARRTRLKIKKQVLDKVMKDDPYADEISRENHFTAEQQKIAAQQFEDTLKLVGQGRSPERFRELTGLTPEEFLKKKGVDTFTSTFAETRKVLDDILTQYLSTPNGQTQLKNVISREADAERQKRKAEDEETPQQRNTKKFNEDQLKRRDEHWLATRDKRFSASEAYGNLIVHIGD